MSGTQDQGVLKQQLTALGVNSRGWRLYLDYGYAMFSPLGDRWCDQLCEDVRGDNELAWLKILQACEMDVLPPPELVQSMAQWHIPGDRLEVLPPLFLRLAWKACVAAQYRPEGQDDFVETELTPLAQWFFVSGAYRTVDASQLKAGWNCMIRLRREHVAVLAQKMGVDDWPPVARRFESGPYTMSALSYAHQLIEEGEAMQHCVGDYVERCRLEPLRIFSIRHKKSGQRVATLSLVEKERGVWDFDQLKGPKNADVDPQVWQEADGLRQKMNLISCSDFKTRDFLDFIHSLGVKSTD
jgi:hypothetical protein